MNVYGWKCHEIWSPGTVYYCYFESVFLSLSIVMSVMLVCLPLRSAALVCLRQISFGTIKFNTIKPTIQSHSVSCRLSKGLSKGLSNSADLQAHWASSFNAMDVCRSTQATAFPLRHSRHVFYTVLSTRTDSQGRTETTIRPWRCGPKSPHRRFLRLFKTFRCVFRALKILYRQFGAF